MNVEQVMARMAQSAAAMQAVLEGIGETQAHWKPDPESWSVLEVVIHLWDEEREDFRRRIDYTLHRPGEVWPPIDPARIGIGSAADGFATASTGTGIETGDTITRYPVSLFTLYNVTIQEEY